VRSAPRAARPESATLRRLYLTEDRLRDGARADFLAARRDYRAGGSTRLLLAEVAIPGRGRWDPADAPQLGPLTPRHDHSMIPTESPAFDRLLRWGPLRLFGQLPQAFTGIAGRAHDVALTDSSLDRGEDARVELLARCLELRLLALETRTE